MAGYVASTLYTTILGNERLLQQWFSPMTSRRAMSGKSPLSIMEYLNYFVLEEVRRSDRTRSNLDLSYAEHIPVYSNTSHGLLQPAVQSFRQNCQSLCYYSLYK